MFIASAMAHFHCLTAGSTTEVAGAVAIYRISSCTQLVNCNNQCSKPSIPLQDLNVERKLPPAAPRYVKRDGLTDARQGNTANLHLAIFAIKSDNGSCVADHQELLFICCMLTAISGATANL